MRTGIEGRKLRPAVCLSLFHPTAGGAEGQFLLLAQQWANDGHSPVVFTRSFPHLVQREIYQGIEIRRSIRTIPVGPLFGLSFLTSLALSLSWQRKKFDVVITGQAPWEAIATGLAKPFVRKPTIVVLQQTGPFGDLAQLERAKAKTFLRSLFFANDHFVALSELGRREFLDAGGREENLTILTGGVDTAKFQPPSTLEPARMKRVLFVGRLVPQKDPVTLLHAWKEVNQEGDYTLSLAGAGPMEGELKNLAKQLELKNVEFLGRVEDVRGLYRSAGVFVLPSVGEGCPNALLEAMATSCMPVVSDIGGINDVVTHQRTGLLCRPGDARSLAQQLLLALCHPEKQMELGFASRRVIEQRHSSEIVARRYIELFERVVASNQHTH